MLDIESIGVDIGTMIPGLDDVIASEIGEEVAENVSDEGGDDGDSILDNIADEVLETVEETDDESVVEDSSEKPTQESEPGDNGVKSDDVLGQALARLAAIENENRVLRDKAEATEIELSTPRFIPYSKLPPETQAMFDQLAEQYEVTPESLVREHYNEILAEHRDQVRARHNSRDAEIRSANAEIDRFFDAHPLKGKHGEAVMASVRDAGFAKIVAIARHDPDTYKATAIALIDAHFRKAEGDAAIKTRQVKQQEQLKRSTRSEASRPASAGSVLTTSQKDGQKFVKDIVDYVKRENSLDSLFR